MKQWLEQEGHAVLDTGMARSELAAKGIREAKQGNTLGPITMTLFYTTDLRGPPGERNYSPRCEPVSSSSTDRYIFSIIARAIARSEDRAWIDRVAGIALVPHAIYYLRAEVSDLITRVVVGKGAFDYWESGLDLGFGPDMYESFVRYQTRLIKVFDQLSDQYGFHVIDARQSADQVFQMLQASIETAFQKGRKGLPEPLPLKQVIGIAPPKKAPRAPGNKESSHQESVPSNRHRLNQTEVSGVTSRFAF